MTQRTIKIFIDGLSSKAPRKMYITIKSHVCHDADTWSLNILDLNVYGPKKERL